MVHHVDERTYPHDHDNKARIYVNEAGMCWVTHEELLECGYRGLSSFDVVYLNGKFWELQGHIHKAKAWWIEEVELGEAPETPDEQAPETTEGEPT